jgi:hypothetical protein
MRPGSIGALTSTPPRAALIRIFVLALSVVISLNALAFDSPLQQDQVEEAYYLGQTSNHEDLAAFLKPHKNTCPYPADNPDEYTKSIEFQTPYEQIVLRSAAGGARYEKSQAEEAYQANPDLVIVRAVFALRINYAGPIPPADSFEVRVSQSKSIAPRKLTTTPLCGASYPVPQFSASSDCAPYPYTLEVDLQFDADQFAPGRVTVKAIPPTGPPQEAKFNLDKLK